MRHKINFLACLILFSSSSSYSQSLTDRDHYGLVGPVLRMQEFKTDFPEIEGQDQATDRMPTLDLTFDEQGHCLQWVEYTEPSNREISDSTAYRIKHLLTQEEDLVVEKKWAVEKNTQAEHLLQSARYNQDGTVRQEQCFLPPALHSLPQEVSSFLIFEASTDAQGGYHEWGVNSLSSYRNHYDSQFRLLRSDRYQSGSLLTYQLWTYNEQGSPLETSVLDGNGKLIHRTVSHYDEAGRKTAVEKIDSSGNSVGIITWSYDLQGNLLKFNSVGINQNLFFNRLSANNKFSTNYQWNEKGELVFEERNWIGGLDTSYKQYDDKGNLIRQKHTTSYSSQPNESVVEWEYEADHRPVAAYVWQGSKRFLLRQWNYDGSKRLSAEIGYQMDGAVNRTVRYFYNPQDRLVMKKEETSHSPTETTRFFYDETGNLIHRIRTNEQGEIKEEERIPSYRMSYEFDPNGNPTVIKQEEYVIRNGVGEYIPKSTFYRIYTYLPSK